MLTRDATLFALSFEPDRDGVRATCRGRDAYLTRDDLRRGAAYRPLMVGWLDFGLRLERERVLELLSRELGCPKTELASDGHLRRFVTARLPAPETPETPAACGT